MIHIGDIVIGAGASKNNTNTTGTPFAIAQTAKGLYYLTQSAGVTFRSQAAAGAGPSPATPSSLAATAADFPLASGQAFGEVFTAGAPIVLACYNSGGSSATVSVYQVQAQ